MRVYDRENMRRSFQLQVWTYLLCDTKCNKFVWYVFNIIWMCADLQLYLAGLESDARTRRRCRRRLLCRTLAGNRCSYLSTSVRAPSLYACLRTWTRWLKALLALMIHPFLPVLIYAHIKMRVVDDNGQRLRLWIPSITRERRRILWMGKHLGCPRCWFVWPVLCVSFRDCVRAHATWVRVNVMCIYVQTLKYLKIQHSFLVSQPLPMSVLLWCVWNGMDEYLKTCTHIREYAYIQTVVRKAMEKTRKY